MPEERLTFVALDGIAFAAARGRLNEILSSRLFAASALGPFLELRQLGILRRAAATQPLELAGLGSVSAFDAALRAGRTSWICPISRAAGFFRTPRQWQEDSTEWVGFGLAAQKAATTVGFPTRIAARFVAALGELVSNIHEHSHAPETGIAAFKADVGEFEFAVADTGIGVRDSLAHAPTMRISRITETPCGSRSPMAFLGSEHSPIVEEASAQFSWSCEFEWEATLPLGRPQPYHRWPKD